MDLNVRYSEI